MILAVMFTAAGLPNLEFHGGRFLEIIHTQVDPTKPFGAILGAIIISFLKAMIIISFAIVPILIIYLLSKSQGRMLLIMVFCLGVLLLLFMKYFPSGLNLLPPPKGEIRIEAPTDSTPFLPGEKMSTIPPRWFIILVSLGLSGVVIGVLIVLFKTLQRRIRPLDLVAMEAQKSLEELRSGGDIKESVVRCYFEMIRIVREHRGLERGRATTTRELERELEAMGLPMVHIRRLTRLFENVRYGAKYLSKEEDQEAISCLTAIVQACEEAE